MPFRPLKDEYAAGVFYKKNTSITASDLLKSRPITREKMKNLSHFRLAALIVCAWLMSTRDAQAYIDPGSGSYLFQILIGALTAAVFFFGTVKRRVVCLCQSFFGRKRAGRDTDVVASKPAPLPKV